MEKPRSKTLVFLLRGYSGKAQSWKMMREQFLGDKSPNKSPEGSIRFDAFAGRMNITENVPFWKNIAHMSSGPFEGLLERTVWFDDSLHLTSLGSMLFAEGYSKEEIVYFLTDPRINIGGVVKPLLDWTEKMETNKAVEFLKKVFPSFYSENAMPTITFTEWLRYMELHQKGKLSVATNKVRIDEISEVSAEITDYTQMDEIERETFREIGNGFIELNWVSNEFEIIHGFCSH